MEARRVAVRLADGRDGGFVGRHPELKKSKGTIQLRPETADAVTDEELRALVRAALPDDG